MLLADATGSADIVIDAHDFDVVKLAAGFLREDFQRVSGHVPALREGEAHSKQIVIAGTLGHNAWIDRLLALGKLHHLDKLRNGWETTSFQIVEKPFPSVDRAFVIVGSDRRGTAYGLMELSEKIGVSPWYWWADVPVAHHAQIEISCPNPEDESPGVKYRGIFINDEDWGLNAWARTTFDPQFKNIGPKTYAKVFELMLRLKLNYLWPAMHPCSTEFGFVPENVALADRYAIVMGSSHCEPMLRNNVWWPKENGPWRYDTNRTQMLNYWEQGAKTRGHEEAVWTLGMRGIHDGPMLGPPDVPSRVNLLAKAISDQRDLIARYVTPRWGPIAECFIPYKEVLPLYDAGLKVPPDVTLVWADDNFGYLRRLDTPTERTRMGGSGFYYHLSYVGGPLSYSWINTTPPALMWEEMRKAWDNDARTIWMINVGDIKPAEAGIDFFARLAWDPASWGPDAEPHFLRDFARENFGNNESEAIASFYAEYFRLGQIRKPECMTQTWANTLTPHDLATLLRDYRSLLEKESQISAGLPSALSDAWIELAGYPARMLAASGLVFLEDRLSRGESDLESHAAEVGKWRDYINAQTAAYNDNVAGGKWRGMMPSGDSQGREPWYVEIRWPWVQDPMFTKYPLEEKRHSLPAGRMVPAADWDRQQEDPCMKWTVIEGLGHSNRAVALLSPPQLPGWASASNSAHGPALEYDFDTQSEGALVALFLLPTYRLYPSARLTVAVSIDHNPRQLFEVPGSQGEDENGPTRRNAVLNSRVNLPVAFPALKAGHHTLKVEGVDPGVIMDEICLPL